MGKRNSHEPSKARRKRFLPEEEMSAEYNEVDEFLQLLRRIPMFIWSESGDEYAEDFLSRFDSRDWQALKERLPFLTASEATKLCICLSPDDQAQLPVVMELIHTGDPDVFKNLLISLFNRPTNEGLPEEAAAELVGKALLLLQGADVPDRKLSWDVIEKYRRLAPEALQSRIPKSHRKRMTVNYPSGEANTLTFDISDAALDHPAILLDFDVVSPQLVSEKHFYSWREIRSARETVELSFETNMTSMDLEVEITWL